MPRYRIEIIHRYFTTEVVEVEMSDDSIDWRHTSVLWDRARELGDPHGWDELPIWDEEPAEIADVIRI